MFDHDFFFAAADDWLGELFQGGGKVPLDEVVFHCVFYLRDPNACVLTTFLVEYPCVEFFFVDKVCRLVELFCFCLAFDAKLVTGFFRRVAAKAFNIDDFNRLNRCF